MEIKLEIVPSSTVDDDDDDDALSMNCNQFVRKQLKINHFTFAFIQQFAEPQFEFELS